MAGILSPIILSWITLDFYIRAILHNSAPFLILWQTLVSRVLIWELTHRVNCNQEPRCQIKLRIKLSSKWSKTCNEIIILHLSCKSPAIYMRGEVMQAMETLLLQGLQIRYIRSLSLQFKGKMVECHPTEHYRINLTDHRVHRWCKNKLRRVVSEAWYRVEAVVKSTDCILHPIIEVGRLEEVQVVELHNFKISHHSCSKTF